LAEGLADIEPIKVLLFIAPGASFAIFRSLGMRGFFPKRAPGRRGVGVRA
jgi:hypothetical protein